MLQANNRRGWLMFVVPVGVLSALVTMSWGVLAQQRRVDDSALKNASKTPNSG